MIGAEPQGATSEVLTLVNQIKVLMDQEPKYQPKISGLRIIESARDNGLHMSVQLRDLEVKELLSLSQFFGFSADVFVLSVHLLDRFLSMIKVQPRHLGCVGLTCCYLAVKVLEEEGNVPPANDLIRISQCRFKVSDMIRMERIILETLRWRVKAPTALSFLRLYHTLIMNRAASERKKILNLERLEAQLKACSCHFAFSKSKSSTLAFSILSLEVQAQKLHEIVETVESLQQNFKISNRDLVHWRECVAKCLAEYSSSKCSRPNNKKLKWIVSRSTTRHLQPSWQRITPLPTIPEAATCVE